MSRVYGRLKKFINNTPLEYNERLSKIHKCNVFLKREDLQITRSFKLRGALNKILKKKDNYNKFVCASAGNHAQGVAYASQLLNLKSKIYVPSITPIQKISSIIKHGKGNIELEKRGLNFTETLNYALENKKEDELFIHPYDDYDIIEGQSTVCEEIFNVINPDIIISCVGGGGLVSGLLEYNNKNSKFKSKYNGNKTEIIGVEPLGAESMKISLEKNKIVNLKNVDTFVDGASVSKVGELTYNICKKNNLEINTVSNNRICYNMVELYNNEGIISEPAGVLSVSVLDKLDREKLKNKNVVCILSGGNNDIMRYPEIMEKNLMFMNVKHYFIIEFNQKPNQLKNFINNILDQNDDITRFEYMKKTNKTYGKVLIGIDTLDIENLINNLDNYNYKYIKLKNDSMLYNYLV